MSMPTCPSCKYARGVCGKTGVSIRHSTGCTYHEPKPLTNYDLLISKTPEELALYIHNAEAQAADTGRADTVESWLDWLKSPVEVDNGT